MVSQVFEVFEKFGHCSNIRAQAVAVHVAFLILHLRSDYKISGEIALLACKTSFVQ